MEWPIFLSKILNSIDFSPDKQKALFVQILEVISWEK